MCFECASLKDGFLYVRGDYSFKGYLARMQVKCIKFNSLLHPGLGSKFCSAIWRRAAWSILDLSVGSGPNQIICVLLGMSGHDPALPGLNRSESNSSLLGCYLELWSKVPDAKVLYSLTSVPVPVQFEWSLRLGLLLGWGCGRGQALRFQDLVGD